MEVSLNLVVAILIVLGAFSATLTILYAVFWLILPAIDRGLYRLLYKGTDEDDAHASNWERR